MILDNNKPFYLRNVEELEKLIGLNSEEVDPDILNVLFLDGSYATVYDRTEEGREYIMWRIKFEPKKEVAEKIIEVYSQNYPGCSVFLSPEADGLINGGEPRTVYRIFLRER